MIAPTLKRTGRAVRASMLAGALLAALATPVARPDAAADDLFTLIGKLDRYPTDVLALFGEEIKAEQNKNTAGTIILLPEQRRLWQIFPSTDPPSSTIIVARDLDTLEIADTVHLPVPVYRPIAGNGSEWTHDVAPDGRVFMMSAEFDGTGTLFNAAVLELSSDLEPTMHPLPSHIAQSMQFGGLSYDPLDKAVHLIGRSPPGSFSVLSTVWLMSLDPATDAITGPRRLRACDGGTLPGADAGRNFGVRLLYTEDHVFVPCQRNGEVGSIVRLPRDSALSVNGPEEVASGPTNIDTTLVDRASGRFAMMTLDGQIWIFDAGSMSFLGVASVTPDTGHEAIASYGMDPESGRVYFQSILGTGAVEARFFPIPQARISARRQSIAHDRIWVDPKTDRIFVLEGDAVAQNTTDAYRIYRVSPPPPPPPPPDPDANTVDRAEKAGVTQSQYFGSASGYGARVLAVHGVVPVVPTAGAGALNYPSALYHDYLNPKCGFTDRELVAGRIAKAELDATSAAAEAIAVDIDDRTKLDLEEPSRCDVALKNNGTEAFGGIFTVAPPALDNDPGADPRWRHDPALCSSSAVTGAGTAEGDDHDQPALGTSRVACPEPGQPLIAEAESALVGAVSVARSWTKARVFRDGKGVHSTVEAVAQGIDIGGLVKIGEVRTIATSTSNGRPRSTAGSTHQLSISGVTIGGVPVCAACDPAAALAALNQAVPGRLRFRLGSEIADADLVAGSPGGASTAVQKSVRSQVSDQALNGDFTTDVPALELAVYNDSLFWGSARQIYQFAGASTAATYNIVVLPKGLPPGPVVKPTETDKPRPAPSNAPTGGGGDQTVLGPADGDSPVPDVVEDAVKAVAKGLRILFQNPREALLVATAWAMFGLPLLLARRRQALLASAHHAPGRTS